MRSRTWIIMVLVAGLLSACSDWLDVKPEDEVDANVLFETGQGYRNALNGVYNNMAEGTMYGKEMTWGTVDVIAQLYESFETRYTWYKVMNYEYTDKDVKSIVSNIWSNTYTAITNCNNLLAEVDKATPDVFAEGQIEKNLILGEAYALRAYLHFDILRLFAPAPIVADNKGYIPYFEKHGSLSEPYLSVDSVIGRVERDLLRAKNLLAMYDTVGRNAAALLTDIRLEGASNALGGDEAIDDLFFFYRGYRMNYYAVTAMLARVYDYARRGEEACKQALEVIHAKGWNSSDSRTWCFDFTETTTSKVFQTPKLHDGVIFGLSNSTLIDDYKPYVTNEGCQLKLDKEKIYGKSLEDVRASLISADKYSLKYQEHSGGVDQVDDLIPMIRLSEMYFIVSDYLYRNGKTVEMRDYNDNLVNQDGIRVLRDVRFGRGITEWNETSVTNIDEMENAIIAEARREFIGEGQLFFYYKKYNKKPVDGVVYSFPLPDNELIH